MKKNSVKNIRINSEVQREMSQIIREDIKDPRVHPLTSVMAVEVTPDLKFAKIFISVFGNEEEKEKTMEGLKKSAAFARMQLAKRMNLRNTPELTFILDESIEYGVNMSKKIDEVNHKKDRRCGYDRHWWSCASGWRLCRIVYGTFWVSCGPLSGKESLCVSGGNSGGI